MKTQVSSWTTRYGRGITSLFFLIMLLYFSRTLIIPILYGVFVALILYPLCSRLERWGWNRWLSILTGLTLVLILFSGLVLVIFYQYNLFKKDLPLILAKITPLISSALAWLNLHTGLDESPDTLLQNVIKYSGSNMGSLIRSGLSGTFNFFFNILIIPLYAALILRYRTSLVNFIFAIIGNQNTGHLRHILLKTVKVYTSYIKGMILVYLIVGVLNSIGLLLLGVKYAVLFGMLTAIMTIIPYFGIIFSSLLPISIAWITTDSIYYPLGVVFVFSIVQYLEGNFIYPWIVGKRMNLNILASLVSVLAGGLLWGVSGMVLFLPLTAILKIVADEIDDLKPLALLLKD